MEVTNGTIEIVLDPDTTYDYKLVNQGDFSVIGDSVLSDPSGNVTITIPADSTRYDAWYSLEVSNGATPVYIDTVVVVHPYVSAADAVAYTGNKITTDQAVEFERVARYLIDSIVGFKFSYERKKIHAVGNGTDFLPTHERINKVYSIKENNETLWETTDIDEDPFIPWVGGYGIVLNHSDANNRLEYPVVWETRYASPVFKMHSDYVADVDAGWPVVPHDIREACLMLINDIACGNSRYSGKYLKAIDNGGGQRLQYFDQVLGGTGNLIVDNILSKYVLSSVRAQVL